MALDANKELAYRAIELWLTGNANAADTFMAPDYTNHQDSEVGVDSAPRNLGLAEFKAVIGKFNSAFSDDKVTSRMQVAEGGPFLDEQPTKKTIRWDSVEIVRIENGKIAETWVTWDKYGMFKQIELIR